MLALGMRHGRRHEQLEHTRPHPGCDGAATLARRDDANRWTVQVEPNCRICRATAIVPRSLVLGNGNTLVGFDATYSVRDIYFPRVGDANHTMGNVCRTGFFIDGRFAWLTDPAWDRQLGYVEDSLVTDVTLNHPTLGITVKFADYVDLARNWFIRNVEVTSPAGFKVGRVFFHYDWYIEGS